MRKILLSTILSCTAIFFSSTTIIWAIEHDMFTTPLKTPALIHISEKQNSEKELIATFLNELNKITPLKEEKYSKYYDAILLHNSLTLSGISDSGLTQLWPHLLKLSWLKQLDLSNNKLTLIPSNISEFPYLTAVNLSGNSLKTFSFISNGNMALTEVNLAKNELEKVEIKTLSPTFTSLDLHDNKITSLVLEALSLQQLNISENPSQIIGSDLFESLQNLTYLNMSRLYVGKIPEKIGLLTKLEELDISLNNLTILPQSMMNLTALRKIHAQRNNLKEVLFDLSNAVHLEYLDLSYNKLKEMPQVILTLNELIELNLNDNPITEFVSLSCLPNLKTIKLVNTFITSDLYVPEQSDVKIYYTGKPLYIYETSSDYDGIDVEVSFNLSEDD